MAQSAQSVSLYTWACSLFAAVGSLLYGIDSGIVSTVISQPAFLAYFAPFTPAIKGAVVSIFSAGAFFGVIFAGWSADYLGKYSMQCLLAITNKTKAVNVLFRLQASSPLLRESFKLPLSMWACLSLVVSLAASLLASWVRIFQPWKINTVTYYSDMTIPIYNSEIAPPAKRGMISGLHAQFVGIGFAAANVS